MLSIFDVAGSAMQAQSVRLNLTASNLANADSVSGPDGEAYRARQPVFSTLVTGQGDNPNAVGVAVAGIVESQAPLARRYQPKNPLADEQGYVEASNVNVVEEMANMMSASRSYQSNVEMLNTVKELALRTLQLGR